jgi:glycosyltransferase involved in cell wall biosynthesis
MRVAVLTLTRDRLDYTKHCFASLRENAGCEYDHYVLDQGSTDGTLDWLSGYSAGSHYTVSIQGNMGISRGMNFLLHRADVASAYDVVVKFDNDCELTQPNTLRDICELVHADGHTLLSPRILGLNNPPAATGVFQIAGEEILDIPQIGGIFLAAPATVYDTYRYPGDGPGWGLDDADICRWYRSQGGRCGYVQRLTANHYETTSGQHDRYPDYFARTLAEGKPAL